MVYRRNVAPDDAEFVRGPYDAEGYAPDPYEPSEGSPRIRRSGGWDVGRLADDFLDDLLPEELDWRRLVRTYPKTTVALAIFGGFLLGRSHGRDLVLAAKSTVVAELTRAAEEAVGGLVD